MLEGSHNGDAAARCRLAANLHAGCRRFGPKRFDMAAQQGLVGGDHVLARGERVLEDLGRGVLAADELDHNVYGGVADHVVPVCRERLGADAQLLGARLLERACAADAQVGTVCGEVVVMVLLNQADHAATDGAQAHNANSNRASCLVHARLLS